MWYVIIIFIISVLGKFLWDRRKLEIKIKKAGGMRILYGHLISLIMEEQMANKIFSESKSSISLGFTDTFTVSTFTIVGGFRKSFMIVYCFHSRFFGDFKLEWSFDQHDNPEFVVYRMKQDIEAYSSRIMPR